MPPTDTPTPTPEPLVYPVGPTGFTPHVNPLTGLQVADIAFLDRRPIAVKVSNFPRSARPQAGLSKADVIFEWYTEHGSTRFMAMYYGQQAEKVGPIRSVRVQDFSLVPLFDAILVHVAGYGPVIEQMNLRGIDAISEFGAHSAPGAAIWRDETVKEGVNQVFANTVELTRYAKRVGIDSGRPLLEGWMFDPAPPQDAKKSVGLTITFSQAAITQWKYDETTSRYLRFSETESGKMAELLDSTTNSQIAVDNLIVLFAPWNRFLVMEGNKVVTNEMWDFDFTKSGKAFFFRDGVVVQGQWINNGANMPLKFADMNGGQFAMHPGSTYIAVVPALAGGGGTASTEYRFYGYP